MTLEEILNKSGYKFCAVQDGGLCFVVLAYPYLPYVELPSGYGNIDAYYVASNKMYHDVKELKKKIINEGYKVLDHDVWLKPMGERGGLGSTLRNTLLCNAEYGTRMVLSAIVVESDYEKILKEKVSDMCLTCGACINACPTNAIDETLKVPCCLRCVQEYPQMINPHMGNRVLGCDNCQRCCPHNSLEKVNMPKEFMEILKHENLKIAIEEPSQLAKSLAPWIGKNYARVSVIVALIKNYIEAESVRETISTK